MALQQGERTTTHAPRVTLLHWPERVAAASIVRPLRRIDNDPIAGKAGGTAIRRRPGGDVAGSARRPF
jgi:hypothetical protein